MSAFALASSALGAVRRRPAALLGVADQGVIGAGNLTMGLFVLRLSTKEEYGLYGLFYATLMLLNGFCNALFIGQLTVSFHGRHDREGAAASMLCSQLLLSAALGFATALAAFLLPQAALSPEVRRLLVVSALACPAVMLQDFLRGYFFLVERAASALLLDVCLILGWFGLAAGLRAGAGLSTDAAALSGFGGAALLASAIGLAQSRLRLGRGWRHAARALVEAWSLGRWALGGALVTALQNQAHIYLLALVADARALAELNAARMLMMPVGLLIVGVGRALLPAMAKLAAERRPAELRRVADRALLATVAVVCLYSAAVGLGRHFLIDGLLGKSYGDVGGLVFLWMVVLLLQAADANLSMVLQVTKRFRDLMLINLWTVAPVLALAVPMIRLFGPEGNLLTLILGYAAMLLLLWPSARRSLAELASPGDGTRTSGGDMRVLAAPIPGSKG